MSRLGLMTALMLALLLPFAAAAQTPSEAEQSQFKAIVKGQIEAFQRDDGVAAYGYAAPGIQALFPSPETFLGMVRQAYPPVYRPSSIAYGEVIGTPSGPMAKVFLTAADGTNWIALYSFERQADGSWKISGCRLLKDTAPTI